MKLLLSAILLAAICLVPRAGSTSSPVEPPGEDLTVSVTVAFAGGINRVTRDSDMLLDPAENCDPKMLIPVAADSDPGFLLDPYTVTIIK